MLEAVRKIILEHTDEKIIIEILSLITGLHFKELNDNSVFELVFYFNANFDIHLVNGKVIEYPFDDDHLYFDHGMCYFYWGDVLAGSFYKNSKDMPIKFNLTNIITMRNDVAKEVTDILHRMGSIKSELTDEEFVKETYNNFIITHPEYTLQNFDVNHVIDFNIGKWRY